MTDEELEAKRKYRREYMRRYNASEKGAEYNRKHVREWRQKTGAPRSKTRQSSSSAYRGAIIDFLLKRDGLTCGICGESLEKSELHINHIIPDALGGKNTLDNYNLTHPACNIGQSIAIRKESAGY